MIDMCSLINFLEGLFLKEYVLISNNGLISDNNLPKSK